MFKSFKMNIKSRIEKRLKFLYKNNSNETCFELLKLIDKYYSNKIISRKRILYKSMNSKLFSENDVTLITYGDSIYRKGEKPLKTLNEFLLKHVGNTITCLHILPFFPYSSDDGFSVIDYKKVDPKLGSWKDIRRLDKNYRLMADLVINHISSKSLWFKKFIQGDSNYKDYFIWYDHEIDTSKVFRPRTHPLLTKFDTKWGKKYVWTTFSEDQIDLNFSNPKVFIEMIDVLLFYFSQGIEIIRLDAIGFLWKKHNTNCFHLKETHEMVKLIRDITEYIAPYACIITETNVPYDENISYFGDGDEAHMVYQFSFPPLVLDAFYRTDTSYLKKLYNKLNKINSNNLFFNFLASHDGVGVLGAKGYLTEQEFNKLFSMIKKNKGLISYKSLSDGSKVPYEMNINYFDALCGPEKNKSSNIKKFLASQSVILFSKGIPGIYIHSLLGSRNWIEGVKKSGINRRINREKLNYNKLLQELKLKSHRKEVLLNYKKLIEFRKSDESFNPYNSEKVLKSDNCLLVLQRKNRIVVINFSDDIVKYKLKEIKPYDVLII
ncbi:MAG: sugar phosphorylase [Candidatus Woesearchaeota archaeon]